MLAIGQKAPTFTLPDQNGVMHSLTDYVGNWVILYFYPKDDTPGCTKEACGFRDAVGLFAQKNAVILGVSKDSSKSHQKFINKFKLNFPLLSDTSTEMIQSYGAWGEKKFMGKTYQGIHRYTFLIHPQGTIAKIYEKVDPVAHANKILQDLSLLQ